MPENNPEWILEEISERNLLTGRNSTKILKECLKKKTLEEYQKEYKEYKVLEETQEESMEQSWNKTRKK